MRRVATCLDGRPEKSQEIRGFAATACDGLKRWFGGHSLRQAQGEAGVFGTAGPPVRRRGREAGAASEAGPAGRQRSRRRGGACGEEAR